VVVDAQSGGASPEALRCAQVDEKPAAAATGPRLRRLGQGAQRSGWLGQRVERLQGSARGWGRRSVRWRGDILRAPRGPCRALYAFGLHRAGHFGLTHQPQAVDQLGVAEQLAVHDVEVDRLELKDQAYTAQARANFATHTADSGLGGATDQAKQVDQGSGVAVYTVRVKLGVDPATSPLATSTRGVALPGATTTAGRSPAQPSCIPARRLIFHVRGVPGGRVVRVAVRVNHRPMLVRRGRNIQRVSFARPPGMRLTIARAHSSSTRRHVGYQRHDLGRRTRRGTPQRRWRRSLRCDGPPRHGGRLGGHLEPCVAADSPVRQPGRWGDRVELSLQAKQPIPLLEQALLHHPSARSPRRTPAKRPRVYRPSTRKGVDQNARADRPPWPPQGTRDCADPRSDPDGPAHNGQTALPPVRQTSPAHAGRTPIDPAWPRSTPPWI